MSKKADVETTAVVVSEQRNLSAQFTDRAVEELKGQRERLKAFVKSQLKQGINGDYAVIPGTPKPSLLKPGAEKLASLFQLGSRIIEKDHTLDRESGFAMFNYTVEVYHIPTGQALHQSEGSANSEEKKFKGRSYADLLNTLGKIAFKRAFVGAVILATNSSDLFTQDIETPDDLKTNGQDKAQKIQQSVMPEQQTSETPICKVCNETMRRSKANNAWACKNWSDGRNHDYIKD